MPTAMLVLASIGRVGHAPICVWLFHAASQLTVRQLKSKLAPDPPTVGLQPGALLLDDEVATTTTAAPTTIQAVVFCAGVMLAQAESSSAVTTMTVFFMSVLLLTNVQCSVSRYVRQLLISLMSKHRWQVFLSLRGRFHCIGGPNVVGSQNPPPGCRILAFAQRSDGVHVGVPPAQIVPYRATQAA